MELRHLRYFVAVAESLSFTAAAKQLGIAQPPLSVQIRQLEKELGSTLFDRSNRKIRLTAPGQLFIITARRLLEQADRAILDLQDAAAGRSGEIRLAHTASAFSEHITRRMRKFVRKNRGVRLCMEYLDQRGGILNFPPAVDAIFCDVLPDEETTGVIVETSSMRIALSAKHRLAEHVEILPIDLLGERILLAPPDRRSAAERQLVSILAGIDGNFAIVPAPVHPMERLWHTSLGLGVSVCTSADRLSPDALLKPLAGPQTDIHTVLISNPHSCAAGLPTLIEFIRA